MAGLRVQFVSCLIAALAMAGFTTMADSQAESASLTLRPDIRATFHRICAPTQAERAAAGSKIPIMANLGAFDPAWRGRCVAGYLDHGRFRPLIPAPAPRPAQHHTPARNQRHIDLRQATFSDLPGWSSDDKIKALAAFKTSCSVILHRPADRPFGPQQGGQGAGLYGTYGDWQPVCRAAFNVASDDAFAASRFFMHWFRPWQATDNGNPDGLFTGYDELTLYGSRTRHGPYQTPLRALPDDMVTARLGDFATDLVGRSLSGRVTDGYLEPYPDRAGINAGRLAPGEDRPIVWVKDDIRAFFLEIQGSGIVRLDDGTAISVQYAGKNGYAYHAIGAELVRRGIPRDQISMQSIYAWLKAHPDQKQTVMNTNRSYVFFRDAGPASDIGPRGAEGVSLTPERSLAVDRTLIAYGTPVWIAAQPPRAGERHVRRLMIAQDTGGAIRGAVRGDYFWGRGRRAEDLAGVMKSSGRMWLLLPKTLRP